MKIIIVTNAYIKNKSQILQAERIKEELIKLGADCKILPNINLATIVEGNISAVSCDACVFLDKDKAAVRLLEKNGIRLFNNAEGIEVCDDKMLTHIALSNHGIAMPDTIYAPLCYYADAEPNYAFLKSVEKTLSFPLVAKKCFGSLGAGVELIHNFSALVKYEDTNKLTAHFYQRMIGRGGEDIRVIVIGGKVVCGMKRTNNNDFRSNIELGGRGEKVEVDAKLATLCEKVADTLKLDYCGIDVLTDENGKRYICEVNSNAFFAAAEKVCNVNIAKTYAEYIVKSLA
jgi:RimK family alpha-L-glutamate ligase